MSKTTAYATTQKCLLHQCTHCLRVWNQKKELAELKQVLLEVIGDAANHGGSETEEDDLLLEGYDLAIEEVTKRLEALFEEKE